MVVPTGRPDSPIVIAGGDPDLNDALAGLLAKHAPGVTGSELSAILDDVDRRPSTRLLILTELNQDGSTLDLLEEVKAHRPDLAVLLFSTHPTVEHATESIRRGAEDFVPVPFSGEVVRKEVERILEAAELRDHVKNLDQLVATRYGFERVISGSRRMQPVFDRANAASRSDRMRVPLPKPSKK